MDGVKFLFSGMDLEAKEMMKLVLTFLGG